MLDVQMLYYPGPDGLGTQTLRLHLRDHLVNCVAIPASVPASMLLWRRRALIYWRLGMRLTEVERAGIATHSRLRLNRGCLEMGLTPIAADGLWALAV